MSNHQHHQHNESSKNMEHQNHSHHDHSNHKMSDNKKHDHSRHDHSAHHGHMIEDFKKRFWISLVITIPILFLSPLIQKFIGLKDALSFNGNMYVLFVLSSFVFFYGGYPFLKGLINELKKKIED